MSDFQTTIDIQANPDRVWSVMRDVERWHEWTPTITSLRLLDPGPLAIGSRAFIVQPKLRPAEWKVTEYDDRGRRFTWVTGSPGLQVAGSHAVEPAAGGSRATLAITFTGFLAPLIKRLMPVLVKDDYLAMEAQGLKARSESAA